VIKYRLLHPQLLNVLCRAGHGNRILIADANYRFVTGAPQHAEKVYLNFMPDLLSATQVLTGLLEAVNVEAAYAMLMDDDQEPSIVSDFRALLPPHINLNLLERYRFYEQVESPQTMLVIATGEQRLFANLLLEIGVVSADTTER
jgi:L-fucose mutarotase